MTRGRTLLTVLLGSALMVGVAAPVEAAGENCRVRNLTQGTAGSDLEAAIATADPGDRLRLRATCRGNFVIDKDLTLLGRDSATLDGYGAGLTLYVGPIGRVRLLGLDIVGGGHRGTYVGPGATVIAKEIEWYDNHSDDGGGGILNHGELRLRRSVVAGNSASDGGGIFNVGVLVVSHSDINGNVAVNGGGGLFNEGTAKIRDSFIYQNTASYGGGILNANSITIRRSYFADNIPDDCSGC